MGEKQSEQLKLDNEMLTLDIVASDLLTLQALNAARLKEAGAVDATFVTKATVSYTHLDVYKRQDVSTPYHCGVYGFFSQRTKSSSGNGRLIQ